MDAMEERVDRQLEKGKFGGMVEMYAVALKTPRSLQEWTSVLEVVPVFGTLAAWRAET